jgi:hypothetical protein
MRMALIVVDIVMVTIWVLSEGKGEKNEIKYIVGSRFSSHISHSLFFP